MHSCSPFVCISVLHGCANKVYYNLISVQPPRNTRASYHVTLARPPTSSSLRITDRSLASFRYASPCLWNQLPISLRQPHSSPSVSWLPCSSSCHIFSLCQLPTFSIHNSLSFTPGSRPTFFTSLSHHRLPSGLRTDSTALWLVRFSWASRFVFLVFFISLSCLVPCGRLSYLYMLAYGRTMKL